MSAFAVKLTPRARQEILRAVASWRERTAEPRVLDEDLEEALRTLASHPEIGAPHPGTKDPGVRRWLLPRAQLHAYYRVLTTERVVRVLSFWSTARRRGPRL